MTTSLKQLAQGATRRLRNVRLVDRRKGFALMEVTTLQRVMADFAIDCVFDVGANEGQYATMLRKQVGYRNELISFEPLPHEHELLRQRAKADPRWHVENIALSDHDGSATFNVAHGSEFSSLSKPLETIQQEFSGSAVTRSSIEIRTERLATAYDRLQKTHGFDRPFLKLDTQGYDHLILQGGRDILDRFVGFQTELSVSPLYEHSIPYLDALKSYQEWGFRPCAFFPNNYGHFPRLYEIDCVLLRADLL